MNGWNLAVIRKDANDLKEVAVDYVEARNAIFMVLIYGTILYGFWSSIIAQVILWPLITITLWDGRKNIIRIIFWLAILSLLVGLCIAALLG